MTTVVFDRVSKEFAQGTRAVDDLTLNVDDGEFLALVGPSGCGKSTSLRMLAGLESVTSGTIRIDDAVVNRVKPKDRDIAMVFQDFALYPHLTVRENLAFPLHLRRKPKSQIADRVRWAAEKIGILDLLDRRPATLSGGQRQRVALGRAIVREPRLFLFDEPFSNLDPMSRVTMRTELKQLHRELNTTTIHVTHDQEEAMVLGDRVAVMHRGVVHQCGSPQQIFCRPADLLVAQFVGNPPMNTLEGELVARDSQLWFHGKGGDWQVPQDCAQHLREPTGSQPVILGVRPEHVVVGKCDTGSMFEGIVESVEWLGPYSDIAIVLADRQRIYCRSHTCQVATGDKVRWSLAPHDAHFFEPNIDDHGDVTHYGRRLN